MIKSQNRQPKEKLAIAIVQSVLSYIVNALLIIDIVALVVLARVAAIVEGTMRRRDWLQRSKFL